MLQDEVRRYKVLLPFLVEEVESRGAQFHNLLAVIASTTREVTAARWSVHLTTLLTDCPIWCWVHERIAGNSSTGTVV